MFWLFLIVHLRVACLIVCISLVQDLLLHILSLVLSLFPLYVIRRSLHKRFNFSHYWQMMNFTCCDGGDFWVKISSTSRSKPIVFVYSKSKRRISSLWMLMVLPGKV